MSFNELNKPVSETESEYEPQPKRKIGRPKKVFFYKIN